MGEYYNEFAELFSDKYPEAVIDIYKLEYGYQLIKHYYVFQYGGIDKERIVYSVEQVDDVIDKLIGVNSCYSYEQAMIMFIAQLQSPNYGYFDSAVMWICKLLNIDTGWKIR